MLLKLHFQWHEVAACFGPQPAVKIKCKSGDYEPVWEKLKRLKLIYNKKPITPGKDEKNLF